MIQARQDNNTASIIVKTFDNGRREDNAVLLTDAGRTTDLEPGTVMAKIAATGKWVPLTSLTAIDGSAIPAGIFYPGYQGSAIPAADIAAGDVSDVSIITAGIEIDEDSVILENSLDLDTSIFVTSDAANVYFKKSIRDMLAMIDIYPRKTANVSRFENS